MSSRITEQQAKSYLDDILYRADDSYDDDSLDVNTTNLYLYITQAEQEIKDLKEQLKKINDK